MSNRNNPNGFTPYRHLTGGEIRAQTVTFKSTNSEIGIGDPIAPTSDGTWDKWSSGAVGGISSVHKAASVGGTGEAYIDPFITYLAQVDSTTGVLTVQDGMTLNADILNGTPSNGHSTAQIDESSGNTTATLPLKVVGLAPLFNNSFGQYNRLEVVINNDVFKGGTGTVGV